MKVNTTWRARPPIWMDDPPDLLSDAQREAMRDEQRDLAERSRRRAAVVLSIVGTAIAAWQIVAPTFSTVLLPLAAVLIVWAWALVRADA